MHDTIEFYRWLPDWTTTIVSVGPGLLLALALYMVMRQGRVERGNRDTSAKRPIHDYAGIMQSDSNKPTLFVVLFIIFIVTWAIGYVLHITLKDELGYWGRSGRERTRRVPR